jgi:hypothetical protein
MKQFAVELKRTSYVTIYVDAETLEEAEDLAWDELSEDGSYGTGSDADWTLESIMLDDTVTEPETETGDDLAQFYGPSAR